MTMRAIKNSLVNIVHIPATDAIVALQCSNILLRIIFILVCDHLLLTTIYFVFMQYLTFLSYIAHIWHVHMFVYWHPAEIERIGTLQGGNINLTRFIKAPSCKLRYDPAIRSHMCAFTSSYVTLLFLNPCTIWLPSNSRKRRRKESMKR